MILLFLLQVVTRTIYVKPNYATTIKCPVEPTNTVLADPQSFTMEVKGVYIFLKPIVAFRAKTNLVITTPVEEYIIYLISTTGNYTQWLDLTKTLTKEEQEKVKETQAKKKKIEEDLLKEKGKAFSKRQKSSYIRFYPSRTKRGITLVLCSYKTQGDYFYLYGEIIPHTKTERTLNQISVYSVTYEKQFLGLRRRKVKQVMISPLGSSYNSKLEPKKENPFLIMLPASSIEGNWIKVVLSLTGETISCEAPLQDLRRF